VIIPGPVITAVTRPAHRHAGDYRRCAAWG